MTSEREAAMMRVVDVARAVRDKLQACTGRSISDAVCSSVTMLNAVLNSAPVAAGGEGGKVKRTEDYYEDEQPARESAEAVVARMVTEIDQWIIDDFDTGENGVAAKLAAIITADRAAHDARVAELERLNRNLSVDSADNRKVLDDRITELDATIATQAAEIERAKAELDVAVKMLANRSAKIEALESKLAAAGKGADATTLDSGILSAAVMLECAYMRTHNRLPESKWAVGRARELAALRDGAGREGA